MDTGIIRQFETGATRDTAKDKHDPEGFISPLVTEAFCVYMHYNRLQQDGSLRASDNWQKGIPPEAYIKSGYRHFLDWWRFHRGLKIHGNIVWALCGLLFNVQGYLHELLKNDGTLLDVCRQHAEQVRAEGGKI